VTEDGKEALRLWRVQSHSARSREKERPSPVHALPIRPSYNRLVWICGNPAPKTIRGRTATEHRQPWVVRAEGKYPLKEESVWR